MRISVTIDHELLAEAKSYTGIAVTSVLVRDGLKALVERETARRLALLGGSEPIASYIPRRRPDDPR